MMRVTSGGLSRSRLCREDAYLQLSLPFSSPFPLSVRLSLVASSPFLSFLVSCGATRSLFDLCFDRHPRGERKNTLVALHAPNEALGPAMQCSECGGVMRENSETLLRLVATRSNIAFCKSARYTDADI